MRSAFLRGVSSLQEVMLKYDLIFKPNIVVLKEQKCLGTPLTLF
jgi:hypothetical protein